jgi:hypothetical protein
MDAGRTPATVSLSLWFFCPQSLHPQQALITTTSFCTFHLIDQAAEV